jgi:hypothetical protein
MNMKINLEIKLWSCNSTQTPIVRPVAPPDVSPVKGILSSYSFLFLDTPRYYCIRKYSCCCKTCSPSCPRVWTWHRVTRKKNNAAAMWSVPILVLKIDVTGRCNELLYDGIMSMLGCAVERCAPSPFLKINVTSRFNQLLRDGRMPFVGRDEERCAPRVGADSLVRIHLSSRIDHKFCMVINRLNYRAINNIIQ